jgi:hypothetical protein
LSSAILYLAIVAIWACVLVPRWVRRGHPVTQAAPVLATVDEDLEHMDVGTAGIEIDSAAAWGSAQSYSAESYSAASYSAESYTSATYSADAYLAEAGDSAAISVQAVGPAAVSVPISGSDSARSDSARSDSARPAPARPQAGRAGIIQARRRMLTTLVTLAIAAAACTAASLTSAWICLPPAGMLGMYVLLLREAGRADAENYRRRMEAAATRAAARQRAREARAAREAWAAAREPEATAQVIDISSRVRDQLYDQYADATMRAVGD